MVWYSRHISRERENKANSSQHKIMQDVSSRMKRDTSVRLYDLLPRFAFCKTCNTNQQTQKTHTCLLSLFVKLEIIISTMSMYDVNVEKTRCAQMILSAASKTMSKSVETRQRV